MGRKIGGGEWGVVRCGKVPVKNNANVSEGYL